MESLPTIDPKPEGPEPEPPAGCIGSSRGLIPVRGPEAPPAPPVPDEVKP